MICPHGTHAVSFRALTNKEIGVLVITHVLLCPRLPELRRCSKNACSHEMGRMRGDLKLVGRGWNGWGRIQSPEIRLMYYDISLCTSHVRWEATFAPDALRDVFRCGQRQRNWSEMKRSQWWSMRRLHMWPMYKPDFGIGSGRWF